MKKILSVILLVSLGIGVYAAEIDWLVDYDKAINTARNEDKNILVLITAPSWCGPCQYMEANTWPDSDVVSFVDENYIALKVEDILPDGSRNPLLSKFNFSGYPTTFFFSQDMEQFGSVVGGVDPAYLMTQMVKYTDPDFDISSTFETLAFPDGRVQQISINEWRVTTDDTTYTLPEVDRDSYAYLYDEDERYYLAVPLDGADTTIHITYDNGNSWSVWKILE